jgi:Rrf2 family iron-sulfur cluster assembly transcriptional regulator
MKLTTKSAYGIRALIDLAIMYDSGSPVSIRDIAQEEGISCIYLEQIFHRLRGKGIVRSVRGPKGGYILSRDPGELKVYEIVSALEGVVFPERCKAGKGKKDGCERSARCVSKEVWDEVARQIKTVLEKHSLKDLAARALEITPCKEVKVKLYAKSLS